MQRYAMINVRFKTNLVAKGVGTMFDDAFHAFQPSPGDVTADA